MVPPRLTPAALVFSNGQEQGEQQMPEYRGRTRMVRNAIDSGRVALQIQQVQASDDGQYHCRFSHGSTARACVCACVGAGTHLCVFVYVWKAEVSLRSLSTTFSETGLSLTCKSLIHPG